MFPEKRLPSLDKVSQIAASILLAYTLGRFIEFPSRDLSLQVAGTLIKFSINIHTIFALIVAGLIATGADLLIREHPEFSNRGTLQHWILPALTAWTIGLPLYQLPFNWLWWAGLLLGAGLIMIVLISEYIVVYPDDPRYDLASIFLTSLSFALFLILTISLRENQTRLYQQLPWLAGSITLVSLRAFHFRLRGIWAFTPALIVGILISEIASALHYFPLESIPYGLLVLSPSYTLFVIIGNIEDPEEERLSLIGPVIVLITLISLAMLIQ